MLSLAEFIEENFPNALPSLTINRSSLRSFRLPRSHRLVEQRCHVLLAEPLSGAENHDSILDGQGIEVIQHDMVRLRQKGGLARHRSVLEEQEKHLTGNSVDYFTTLLVVLLLIVDFLIET